MKRVFTAGIAVMTAGMLLFGGSAQAAVYTVKSGDSLWKISQTYNTNTSTLIQVNQLASNEIYPGQTLQVPGSATYSVKGGESMWDISLKQGVSLETLITANPQISNPNNVWDGLILNIPDKYGTAVVASSPSLVKPAALTDGIFPLAQGTYTQQFENNYADERYWSANGDEIRKHEGVDIYAEKGTPVYSVLDGEIVNFGWNELGGWRLTIRVNDTTQFYYAHLNGYADGIAKGTKVTKGQLIGYVGSTGYGPEGTQDQFVPHLHFGIYSTTPSWHSIDPFSYLKWWEQKQ
ncbi:LysM peptidoglycan-binding domain-containing protein [Paenibacillus sp. LMG 31456]|uniref:LysM peptidoglycan-binding domain-containing protein n=1 Tax=Paenibacillus foliorum TaxID=2654974 RepID=A0A972H0C6_9BACL|nr:M23 family metallopeptidase [Paenibacillus foliorum]NOU96240.1 LysM peptidoglycan-binding domain-containing protein [Paenibacillus foliorum]